MNRLVFLISGMFFLSIAPNVEATKNAHSEALLDEEELDNEFGPIDPALKGKHTELDDFLTEHSATHHEEIENHLGLEEAKKQLDQADKLIEAHKKELREYHERQAKQLKSKL
jgi:septal ring factor EnvC (AmiA/AmiB activator)